MHSIALIILHVKNWPQRSTFEAKDLAANGTCRQVTLLTLNLCTFEQVFTLPYGLLGRLDSACVSEASYLCTHTHMYE